MTDIKATVENAQAEATFDVLSFVEGTAYPTDEITLYTDAKGATELVALNRERLDLDTAGASTEEITERIAALTEQVKSSALTFSLRGLPPGLVADVFADEDDNDPKEVVEGRENKIIADTIQSVTNAKGARDARVWDAEAVGMLRRFLKEGEFRKLSNSVINVNFNALVFDEATDAGFLGRDSDVE